MDRISIEKYDSRRTVNGATLCRRLARFVPNVIFVFFSPTKFERKKMIKIRRRDIISILAFRSTGDGCDGGLRCSDDMHVCYKDVNAVFVHRFLLDGINGKLNFHRLYVCMYTRAE